MKKIIVFILLLFLSALHLGAAKIFNINEYRAEENFKKGVYYYNETKFLSANEFFIKALQYNPDYYRAKTWLGKSYFKAGYLENAISEWRNVVDNGGADNILINRLNNILYRLKRSGKVPSVKSYVHLKTIDGNGYDSDSFSQPMSLFVNYKNETFITGLASGSILHFDPNFILIKRITKGEKSFKMPFGLVIDSQGDIYISDVKREIVQKFGSDGKFKLLIGGKGAENGRFLGPEAICVDKRDNIYVVDMGNCRVQKFSPDGRFLMKFGKQGDGPGEFFKPTGITIDKKNNLYISDHINRNIQKFDYDGNYIKNLFEDKPFNDLRNIHYYEDYFLVADGVHGGYVYDKNKGTWQNFKHFNYSQDKLRSVSDMAFGKQRSLYILDKRKNTIEVFVPESYKYGNLDPLIDIMDISKYPNIALYCSIYKKDGSPVIGLSKDNFKVRELGVEIVPHDIVETIYDKNKITMLFLVEKSFKMKEYTEEIKEAASYCLKDLYTEKRKDVIKVYNFHQKIWEGLDYSFKKLKILEALTENDYHYVTDASKPLYKSVTEVMNKLSRKAIIFFTAGDFDIDKNFKSYDLEVCRDYARANHVPIFIINFAKKNEKKLKDLARSTHGKYYHYFSQARKIKNIRADILKVPLNNYIIVYETVRNKKLIDRWHEVDLEVNYNKLTGTDKTGYFVPKH